MTYVKTSYLFLKNGLAYKIILGELTSKRTSILVVKKKLLNKILTNEYIRQRTKR